MPGIVGLITRMPREDAERELLQMVETLCHEEFYAAGTWIQESLGIYVGWVARKGSFCDGMPLQNERGDVTLIFSGEEFSDTGTKARLQAHQLGKPHASYLVRLYEEEPTFPSNLNGRFHGLLIDARQGTVILFNDRYGMHRLYYHEGGDAFYFAAEAKAILTMRPELRQMEPRSLGEFVACGSVLENRTLFQGIQVLPPGSKWVLPGGTLESKMTYFEPREWEEQPRLETEEYYRRLREIFSQNLSRYFDGPERVAMSLTAGLDTRMIMSWQKHAPGDLPCFTFGGMRRDCRDVVLAREIARMCGQPHETLRVGEEFLEKFEYYARRTVYLTDGCLDVGRCFDLYLNQRAREIAPVRMTGNYGGEVLRRVRAFKPEEPLPGLFHTDILNYVELAKQTYDAALACHPVSFAVFKQAPWHHQAVLSLEQTQLSMRSPFLDNDFVRAVFCSPEAALSSIDLSLRLIADGNSELLRVPTDRGLAGRQKGISSAAERAFLNFQFKAEYAYDMGMPQWVASLDHAFSWLHLERIFLGRHKIAHFRIWYRDTLAGYVREMLLDHRSLSRPYLNREAVKEVVSRHLKGDRNFTTEIHKLLTLELIHREFVDHSQGADSRAQSAVPVPATLHH